MGKKDEKYDLPPTFDISDVEIFAAGTPKGHTYTEKDIEGIVAGFYETKTEIKPYLKFGHDYDKKDVSFSSVSGLPAVGWIENLRKVGKKIVADFKQVPKKVYELIKAQAYKRVSSEIFWNIEVNGKKYNRLLKAVSLLGADTPAVGSLKDIISLYKSDSEVKEYQFDIENNKIKEVKYQTVNCECIECGYKTKSKEHCNELKCPECGGQMRREERPGPGQNIREEKNKMEEVERLKMENKQYQEDTKTAEKEKKEAEDKVKEADEKTKTAEEDKKKAVEDKNTAEKELEKSKDAETKAEVTAKVEKLIDGGHWYPVDKDILIEKLIADRKVSEVKKYKIGDKETTFEEFFMIALEKFEVDLNTEETSETGDITSKKDNLALKTKAEKYMKDNNVSYKEALMEVSK